MVFMKNRRNFDFLESKIITFAKTVISKQSFFHMKHLLFLFKFTVIRINFDIIFLILKEYLIISIINNDKYIYL